MWKECNRRTFENMDSSGDQLLASFSGFLLDSSRLGDSHLVILSLCSLVLSSLVISFLLFCSFLFHVLFDYFLLFLHMLVFLI